MQIENQKNAKALPAMGWTASRIEAYWYYKNILFSSLIARNIVLQIRWILLMPKYHFAFV